MHKMKKMLTVCYVVLTCLGMNTKAFSQIPMGAYTAEQKAYINAEDPTMTDGRNFKNLPVTMKKGEGAMFYMRAVLFEPQIYIIDNAQVNWRQGDAVVGSDGITSSILILIADKDTSFNVIFTSTLVGSGGEFVYGMRQLDATQMTVPAENDFCGRITYMINHWQCMWYLMDGTDDYYGKTFDFSLLPDNSFELDDYFVAREDVYALESSAEAQAKGAELIENIKKCLDMNAWETQKDYILSDIDGVEYFTTYFNIKGATNEAFMMSFAVIIEIDPLGSNYVVIEFY